MNSAGSIAVLAVICLFSLAAAQPGGSFVQTPDYVSNNWGHNGPSPDDCSGQPRYIEIDSIGGSGFLAEGDLGFECFWFKINDRAGTEVKVGPTQTEVVDDDTVRCPTPFDPFALGEWAIDVKWKNQTWEILDIPIFLSGGWAVDTGASTSTFGEDDTYVYIDIGSADQDDFLDVGPFAADPGIHCRFVSLSPTQELITTSGNTVVGSTPGTYQVECLLPTWSQWNSQVDTVSVSFSLSGGCRWSGVTTMTRTYRPVTVNAVSPDRRLWSDSSGPTGCPTITANRTLQVPTDSYYPRCVIKAQSSQQDFAPTSRTSTTVVCCDFDYNTAPSPSLDASMTLLLGPGTFADNEVPFYFSAGIVVPTATTPPTDGVVLAQYSSWDHYQNPKTMDFSLTNTAPFSWLQYLPVHYQDPSVRFLNVGTSTVVGSIVKCSGGLAAGGGTSSSQCHIDLPNLPVGVYSIQMSNDDTVWYDVGADGNDDDLTVVPLAQLNDDMDPLFESANQNIGSNIQFDVTGSDFLASLSADFRSLQVALAIPTANGVVSSGSVVSNCALPGLTESPPRCAGSFSRAAITPNVLYDVVAFTDEYDGQANLPRATDSTRSRFVVRPDVVFASTDPISPARADFNPEPGTKMTLTFDRTLFLQSLDENSQYSNITIRFQFSDDAYPEDLLYTFGDPGITLPSWATGGNSIIMDVPTIADPLAVGLGRVSAAVSVSMTSIAETHYSSPIPFVWTVTPAIEDFPNAQSGINGGVDVAFVCSNCYSGDLVNPLNIKIRMLGDLGRDPNIPGLPACVRGAETCPCITEDHESNPTVFNVDADFADVTDSIPPPEVIPCDELDGTPWRDSLQASCNLAGPYAAVVVWETPNWGQQDSDICVQISVNTGQSWSKTSTLFSYVRETPADLLPDKPNPEPGSCPVGVDDCQITVRGAGFNEYTTLGFENSTCDLAACQAVDAAAQDCSHPACVIWKDPNTEPTSTDVLDYTAPIWDRPGYVAIHTSNDDTDAKAYPDNVTPSPLPAENFYYYEQIRFTQADISPSSIESTIPGQLLTIGGDTSNLGVENSNYWLVIEGATETVGIPALDQLQADHILFAIPDQIDAGYYPLYLARNGRDFIGGDVEFVVANSSSGVEQFETPLDVDSIVGVILVTAIILSAVSLLVALSIISYRRGFSSTAATVASQLAVSKDPEADPLTTKTDDIEEQIAKTKQKLGRVKEKKDALKAQKQDTDRALRQAEKERIQKVKEEARAKAEAEKKGQAPSRIALAVKGGPAGGGPPGAGAKPGNPRRPSQGRAGSQTGPRRPSQGRAGSQSRPGQGKGPGARGASKERPKAGGAGPNRAGKPSNPPPRGGGGPGARRPSQGRPKSPARPKK